MSARFLHYRQTTTDANFTADHVACKHRERPHSLLGGWGMPTEEGDYKAHLALNGGCQEKRTVSVTGLLSCIALMGSEERGV